MAVNRHNEDVLHRGKPPFRKHTTLLNHEVKITKKYGACWFMSTGFDRFELRSLLLMTSGEERTTGTRKKEERNAPRAFPGIPKATNGTADDTQNTRLQLAKFRVTTSAVEWLRNGSSCIAVSNREGDNRQELLASSEHLVPAKMSPACLRLSDRFRKLLTLL